MSNYSESIYSVDEEGSPLPPAPSPLHSVLVSSRRRMVAPGRSRPAPPPLPDFVFQAAPPAPAPRPLPNFVFPAVPSAPDPPPFPYIVFPAPAPAAPSLPPPQPPDPLSPTAASPPPPTTRPAGSSPQLSDFFIGGKHGTGMTQLSNIAKAADEILSAIEKHNTTATGALMGSIMTKLLHQTPDFVVGLKDLVEMVKDVAKAAEEWDFFGGIQEYRVRGALSSTLKALRNMNFGLFAIVSREKKLPRHVRVKTLEYTGNLHYELERLVRNLEMLLGARLVECEVMLKKIKEVRSVLRKQDGIGDPDNT